MINSSGPVVQSIVTLTSLLRGQLVSVLLLHNQIHVHRYFSLKKFKQLLRESFSHFFLTKNIGIFQIFTSEILAKH